MQTKHVEGIRTCDTVWYARVGCGVRDRRVSANNTVLAGNDANDALEPASGERICNLHTHTHT
jgi:hypothetical protein